MIELPLIVIQYCCMKPFIMRVELETSVVLRTSKHVILIFLFLKSRKSKHYHAFFSPGHKAWGSCSGVCVCVFAWAGDGGGGDGGMGWGGSVPLECTLLFVDLRS